MAVATNADEYAIVRTGRFFPGAVPDLDGQCVSLTKWFMQEMSNTPNPQAPRGDARLVGKTLVAQGHAIEVPYADRRRGDLICYEHGIYGHIGVVLSGDRTFEQNVAWPGVASKIVNGSPVYASRIGKLSEGWRHNQHIYRLKTYKEEEDEPMWNNGQTYNLMYWCLTPAIAERAREADFVGYFGLQDGWEQDKALDAIITSQQWGLLKQEAFPAGGNVPAGTYLRIDKSDIVEA